MKIEADFDTSFVRHISQLCDRQLLAGPGRAETPIVIDPRIGKSFDLLLEDFATERGLVLPTDGSLPQAIASDIDMHVNATLRHRDPIVTLEDLDVQIVALQNGQGGLAALSRRFGDPDRSRICGLFTGPDLAIDTGWQGYGIGSALVAARLIVDGALPTWHHEKPAYTDKGVGVVLAAGRRITSVLEGTLEDSSPCM